MSVAQEIITNIPAHIFGAGSTLCESVAPKVATQASLPMWIMALALALAALYLAWLNYWSGQSGNHSSLYKYLGFHRGEYESKIEVLTPTFGSYSTSGTMIALLAIWITVIALLRPWSGDIHLSLALLVGIAALYIYQTVVINLIGIVADCQGFTKVISTIKGITYSIMAMVATPTILCYLLCGVEQKHFFTYIVGIEVFAIIAIFLYETFLLFLTKKVSLLHTILYLCAVEIFPITLFWGFFCS